MKQLIYIFLTLSFFACKNSNTTSTSAKSEEIVLNSDEPVLIFKKTGCYGTCPMYDVVVYGNGNMSYTGKRFVKLVGTRDDLKMSTEFVKEVLSKAKEIKFFEMQDVYDQKITDLPSTYTTIIDGTTSKKVTARAGIPAELKDFNQWIHLEIMKIVDKETPSDINKVEDPKKPRELEKKPLITPPNIK